MSTERTNSMNTEELSRLDLLISTVENFSCGLTSDYVGGCLENKWTHEKILGKNYTLHDIRTRLDSKIWFVFPENNLFPIKVISNGGLIIYTILTQEELENEIMKAPTSIRCEIDGLSDDGHCFILINIDGKIHIVDSYTSINTKRRLSRRPFDLNKFFELILAPTPKLWSELFLCETTTLDINEHGYLNFQIAF